jgi:DNA primase
MSLPTLQNILDQHAEARRDGDGWKICCPAHEDKNPSLSVAEKNGRLLFHCHAGCKQDDVLRALMYTPGRPALTGRAESKVQSAAVKHSSSLAPGTTVAASRSIQDKEKKEKLWPTPEIAEASFARLALARDYEPARTFLNEQYGLRPELLGDDWRVYIHPGSNELWLVYRGRDASESYVYKAKSLKRDPKGKRFCRFLHGAGGVMLQPGPPGAELVITGGEEKAAAAREAGYWGLSLLTGEKCFPHEYIPDLLEMDPPRIILASDADEAGRKANHETAMALQQAGVPGL